MNLTFCQFAYLMMAAAEAVIDGDCTGVQEANVPAVLSGSNVPSTPTRQAKRRRRLETEWLPSCDHQACAQLADRYYTSNVCLIGELRENTDGGNSNLQALDRNKVLQIIWNTKRNPEVAIIKPRRDFYNSRGQIVT